MFSNNWSTFNYQLPFQESSIKESEEAEFEDNNLASEAFYENHSTFCAYEIPETIILIDENQKEVARLKNPFYYGPKSSSVSNNNNAGVIDSSYEDQNMEMLDTTNTSDNEDWDLSDSESYVDQESDSDDYDTTSVSQNNETSDFDATISYDSDSDDCEIIYANIQATTKSANSLIDDGKNYFFVGLNNQYIKACIYDFIMPANENLDFFKPPTFHCLLRYLELLGLPKYAAANSPLLNSGSVNPTNKRMVTMKTIGDGNCGYRAISILLTGNQEYYWHIRKFIYKHIILNGNNIWGIGSKQQMAVYYQKLEKILQMNPQKMSQEFWCRNEDLYALADLLECNVYTYSPNSLKNYPCITRHFKGNKNIPDAPTLYLLWINNNHFEPILRFV